MSSDRERTEVLGALFGSELNSDLDHVNGLNLSHRQPTQVVAVIPERPPTRKFQSLEGFFCSKSKI